MEQNTTEQKTQHYTMKINGEDILLRFGSYAAREFMQYILQNVNKFIAGNYDYYDVARLMFICYENACMVQDKVPTLKFGDFANYMDEADDDEAAAAEAKIITEMWRDSKFAAQMISNINDAADKFMKEQGTATN